MESGAYKHGCFFVTLCCAGRLRRFGTVVDGLICLNDMGRAAQMVLSYLPDHIHGLQMLDHVIMPDHVHFIVYIDDEATKSLPEVVAAYKKNVTNLCSKICRTQGIDLGRLWQRNYYEHIIRDTKDFEDTRTYIYNNPIKWQAEGK